MVVKKLPANTGDIRDTGLIPGLERPPGEGKGYPLQYSGPVFMDYIAQGVAKSQIKLSDFHFTSVLPILSTNQLPFGKFVCAFFFFF